MAIQALPESVAVDPAIDLVRDPADAYFAHSLALRTEAKMLAVAFDQGRPSRGQQSVEEGTSIPAKLKVPGLLHASSPEAALPRMKAQSTSGHSSSQVKTRADSRSSLMAKDSLQTRFPYPTWRR